MSAYTYIMAKKDEVTIPISCTSRSNYISRFFSPYVPYGRSVEITKEIFEEYRIEAKEEIERLENRIKEIDEEINLILKMEGSIVEKQECIENVLISKREIIEEKEDRVDVINLINFLINILDEDETGRVKILIGVECGWEDEEEE